MDCDLLQELNSFCVEEWK